MFGNNAKDMERKMSLSYGMKVNCPRDPIFLNSYYINLIYNT
jgi:hypothetical protein